MAIYKNIFLIRKDYTSSLLFVGSYPDNTLDGHRVLDFVADYLLWAVDISTIC